MADTLSVLTFANSQFLMNKPCFFGYQNTAQGLATGTWTSLNIDVGVDDNWAGHSNVTNNSRYTCQIAGTYWVSGCYAAVASASGFRAVRIAKNGSPVLGSGVYSPNNGSSDVGLATPRCSVTLAVNDYVEVQGWQSTGGSLNTTLDPELRCSLSVDFAHF